MAGPSTARERKTLEFLRSALPEHEVNPHMRLANIVRSKIKFIRAMSQYEIDFTICDKQTGEVICAVELDDPTHDTADGQRRDANKNRWLQEAGIKLVRIREPKEAHNIRHLIASTSTPYNTQKKTTSFAADNKFAASLVATIVFIGLLMWALNAATHKIFGNREKNAAAQQQNTSDQRSAIQRVQSAENLRKQQEAERELSANDQRSAIQQIQAAENLQKQQEAKRAEVQQKVAQQQPRYERIIVKGKTYEECTSGNVITNETILCMKDHYETVTVSGTQ
ncbi:MAG: DUF2726 domain-containing protein [Nitrosomonadales bacterium]|nr:DUF2726 domain-containing protein [Nitrosomonadales bacterium]